MADISVTAANVKLGSSSATVQRVLYGATVTQGQALYSDTSDSNKYKPADADAAASSLAEGIALTPGVSGDYGLMVTAGLINMGGTVIVGQVHAVSTTLGGVCLYSDLGSGDFVTTLGIGFTTAMIYVDVFASGIAKP